MKCNACFLWVCCGSTDNNPNTKSLWPASSMPSFGLMKRDAFLRHLSGPPMYPERADMMIMLIFVGCKSFHCLYLSALLALNALQHSWKSIIIWPHFWGHKAPTQAWTRRCTSTVPRFGGDLPRKRDGGSLEIDKSATPWIWKPIICLAKQCAQNSADLWPQVRCQNLTPILGSYFRGR